MRLNPLNFTDRELRFHHWVNRKADILSEDNVIWRGNTHPHPIALHKMIDDELDKLRPLKLSITAPLNIQINSTVVQSCKPTEKMFIFE